MSLDDRGSRSAPPSELRRWGPGRSLAEILLDISLWDVEKLEDDVLVIYYGLCKPEPGAPELLPPPLPQEIPC